MSTNASRSCSAATLDSPQLSLTGVTSIATPGERLLVVVARPHEATVECGALVAAAAAAGVTVTIVSATGGEGAPSRLGLSPDELAERRLLELRLAADALGARRVTTLGYADRDEDELPAERSLRGADERQLVIDVLGALRTARPDAIVAVTGDRDRDRVATAVVAAVDVARIVGEDIAVYLACSAPDDRATHLVDVSGVAAKHHLAISMHTSRPCPVEATGPVRWPSTSDAQHLVRVR